MSSSRLALALLVGLALTAALTPARAQELEPRAYSNSPVGTNFLVAGYAYSQGGLSVDPSLPVENAQLKVHSGVLAYARVLNLFGKSGKVDVLLPFHALSGTATVAGQTAQRQTTGFGDPRFRLSVNLYGAPALSTRQFAGYKRDFVIGASVQVSVPLGAYDSSKAVNLGTNRWSIRADFGFSKAFGALTLDVTSTAAIYTDNHDYFGGKTLEQAPIFAWQANFSYEFGRGAWAAFGVTYYGGGRTTVNGDVSDVELANVRAGALLVVPASRRQSIKISYSRGLYTGSGTDFSIFGLAWQYRWGAGN
jgi:hypothetical protein